MSTEPTSSNKSGCTIFVALLVVGIWALSYIPVQELSPRAPASSRPTQLANFINVTGTSWREGGFGAVAMVHVGLRNWNEIAVADISLACDVTARSGTPLQTLRHTIFDILQPNQQRVFENINMGLVHQQAHTIACRAVGARPA